MVSPNRATVKPRVVSPETLEDILLQDVIESRVDQGQFGTVERRVQSSGNDYS